MAKKKKSRAKRQVQKTTPKKRSKPQGKRQKQKASVRATKRVAVVKQKKLQKFAKKRIRDFRGRFVEKKYEQKLRDVRAELAKTDPFITYSQITERIAKGEFWEREEQYPYHISNVELELVREMNKAGKKIIVMVKNFHGKDQRFIVGKGDLKTVKVKIKGREEDYLEITEDRLMEVIKEQQDLIWEAKQEYEDKYGSVKYPDIIVPFIYYRDPVTGELGMIEIDYNQLQAQEMNVGRLMGIMDALKKEQDEDID